MTYHKIFGILLLLIFIIMLSGCGYDRSEISSAPINKLAEWRKGVWASGNGTFTIYTDSHYFVLSYTGDSTNPNLYYAASQLAYHKKGMARKQVMRLRQFPGGDISLFRENIIKEDNSVIPLVLDTTCFNKNTCTIKDGVIYDVIIEANDEYILLATCNGDKEKIYSDGRSAYLPAGGGEYFSYRIEEIQ